MTPLTLTGFVNYIPSLLYSVFHPEILKVFYKGEHHYGLVRDDPTFSQGLDQPY